MDSDEARKYGNLINEAIARLSDESDDHRPPKNSKLKIANNKNSQNSKNHRNESQWNNTRKSKDNFVHHHPNQHYQRDNGDDDDDENDDDDDDDDDMYDEKQSLLPSHHQRLSSSSSSSKKNNKIISTDRNDTMIRNNNENNKNLDIGGVEHRGSDGHHYHSNGERRHLFNDDINVDEDDQLLLQPPHQHQSSSLHSPARPNRANKYSVSSSETGIVNENAMGLTPPSNTDSKINKIADQVDAASQDSTSSNMNKERELGTINWYVYMVTAMSAIGGFLFGYDTGIVSGAMIFIRDYFKLSTTMQEIVISVTILTAWIFSFVAGYMTNRFGRKLVIIIGSFVFTVGGLMMALAHTEYVLLMGRAVVGLAIGLASMAIPVYIAEVAPVGIRGKLVSTNVCFITFGQFVASIVAGLFSKDEHEGWRWMLGLASVPSFLQLIFFFFLPESPRWLVQKGRYNEAYASLRKFRNSNTAEVDIKTEFESIKESCLNSERERQNSKSFRTLLKNKAIVRALIVGSLLSIFQQVAGINTVMYYSATIIQMSGINDKATAVWLSALTASINFIFSFVGLVLVERLGRRLLTLSSLFGVVFSLFILAAGFQLANFNSPAVNFHPENELASPCSKMSTCDQCVTSGLCGFCLFEHKHNGSSHSARMFGSLMMSKMNGACLAIDPNRNNVPLPYLNSTLCTNGTDGSMVWAPTWCPSQYSWMTLAGLMLYLFFFAPGMGPMPWTINSEIYPLWARSFCYSVSTSFNWFFNLLVSLTFLTLTNLLTIYGAFYLYAGLALSGLILFFFILPETKGKSLEQIETLFQGPLFKLSNNSKNLSNLNNVEGSVNTSQSTVLTSSTTSSNNAK